MRSLVLCVLFGAGLCRPVSAVTIPEAKLLADNQPVTLGARCVTYATADFFYVEEDVRNMGIRVEKVAHGLTVGMRADVIGTMKSNTSRERFILATSAVQNGEGTVAPFVLRNDALGGQDWFVTGTKGQRGVVGAFGLNNIGLLVTTSGKYQQLDATTFSLDDGAGLYVKSTVPAGTFLNPDWTYAIVTGVSSVYKLNSVTYLPNLLVRDIEVAQPSETVSAPGMPDGAPEPSVNVIYEYTTTGSICSYGHPVDYSFDWGDGSSSAWSTSTSASHSWTAGGAKTVTVTARCRVHPSVSAASAGLAIDVSDIGEMIYIPAGSFLMGNSGMGDDAVYSISSEKPQHPVYLPSYWIGKYEVTRGEYRKFLTATGRAAPAYWAATQTWSTGQTFTQTENHPVVGVTWYDADAYCTWAGGHLPTEAEWEKAARWTGSFPNIYPWGNTWDVEKCNNFNDHNPAGGGYLRYQTAPVGSYPAGASPYGCQDMAGDVMEWCADWYKSYPGSTSPFDYTNSYRVLRGGSWDSLFTGSPYFRCASRDSDGFYPGYSSRDIGFRFAR